MHKKDVLFFICCLTIVKCFSQLQVPREIQAAYDKGTRSMDGRPGKNYWQNTADYILNINFDPASRRLNGIVNIVYTNSSPDTLNEIWFKLYPNLYQIGAPRS